MRSQVHQPREGSISGAWALFYSATVWRSHHSLADGRLELILCGLRVPFFRSRDSEHAAWQRPPAERTKRRRRAQPTHGLQAAAAWSRFHIRTGFSASAVLISSSRTVKNFSAHVELLSLQIRQLLRTGVGNLGYC